MKPQSCQMKYACDHRGIWLTVKPKRPHPCPVLCTFLKLGIQALSDMLNLFASRTHKVRLNIFSVPSIFLFHLVYMLLNHTWPGIINIFLFCRKCPICGRCYAQIRLFKWANIIRSITSPLQSTAEISNMVCRSRTPLWDNMGHFVSIA